MLSELLEQLSRRAVTLVAVSKTQPVAEILPLYEQGIRHFGENRPQEMLEKYAALPRDIQWHFIGHLQTNKVRLIAPFVQLIHSIDSLKLLQEVDKQAGRFDRIQDCLLQFHIAREETKFGFSLPDARIMLENPDFRSLQHVRICGVMGMATYTDNADQVHQEFRALKDIFNNLQQDYFPEAPSFRECSMGMSGDWQIALEEGSTMVRIGSLIFGKRK